MINCVSCVLFIFIINCRFPLILANKDKQQKAYSHDEQAEQHEERCEAVERVEAVRHRNELMQHHVYHQSRCESKGRSHQSRSYEHVQQSECNERSKRLCICVGCIGMDVY